MRARILPGSVLEGEVAVPGDKSIAHRWLILAATGRGRTRVRGVPAALDLRSTARCLSQVAPQARASLEGWASKPSDPEEPHRFTPNNGEPRPTSTDLLLDGGGRGSLEAAPGPLDCGNSGTTMRLLAGVLASCPFEAVLTGDESLSVRPMERVAEPLRAMGADVRTTEGHPPVEVQGAALRGIRHAVPVPSAQVKGAVLLAGIAAEGETSVEEPAATRDHTERALASLGGPVRIEPGRVTVAAFQHDGFDATLPGDLSSAAFLVAAAALTGSELVVRGVGLNPSRTHFLDVLERMGVGAEERPSGEELGEPVGDLHVSACDGLEGTTVEAWELPLLIDEVPVLAGVAAHAQSESRFVGAGELRVKESDRLGGLASAIRALGGRAGVEGDDLVVAGGGLEGGRAEAAGDHRMAMALAVAALAAKGACELEGIEAAEVSFPWFLPLLSSLGARIEG